MASTAKLTKRQKKFIAFRERKRSRTKDSPKDLADNSEDEHDVPILEHPVSVDSAQSLQGRQVSEEEVLVGKRKARGRGPDEAKGEGRRVVVAEQKGKRKAGEDEEEDGESDEPKPKRRKGSARGLIGGVGQPVEDDVEAGEAGLKEDEKTKQRLILFLGNLKYTTTLETIQAHFSVCVPPPSVRLLTPKPSTKSPAKPVVKSKGCAFLEFTHRGALQQGLKLHHSQLDGRQINVELTAGGGGKGATRLKKLRERNKELDGQRTRKRQDHKMGAQSEGAQRFSATSGTEQIQTHERTWTVGDVEETDTHRGGQKHNKRRSGKRVSAVKDFRTGVNAIPVG